ncbi:CTP synthase C-terminal region-related (seleno)protein [Yinghuangia seranimata]|uniref:CTP synthase C-terminal region-related (seleno)protein n=1 Tax=Yinghuangia seranimata TaxID=408067 RepID=UPI00248AC8B2|nr:hypothetical protein [Yinghuangia seranimata]MDI2131079.1 hypothetical protein [Yinghuangia seranimata]
MNTPPATAPRLAVVADRSPGVRAHARIPGLLEALATDHGLVLDAYWIPTEDVTSSTALAGFDGVWLPPGSPYASEAGALTAVRTARELGIPFLGTCAGFQHALLEFARNAAGLPDAAHAENDPSAADPLITQLACSLVGHEGAVVLAPGSRAAAILGAERTVERYHCSYGPNPAYLDQLRAHGIEFTGTDESGDARIAELPDHPFFMATLFQPELADDGTRPHPVIRAFAEAVAAHASVGV